jgi:hypothetical protein
MNAFKIIETSEKIIGEKTRKRILISKKNKAVMTPNDIREVGKLLMKTLKKKYNIDPDLVIRGLAPEGQRTLKRIDADIDDIFDDNDYLNGRPAEQTKFLKYDTADFYLYY